MFYFPQYLFSLLRLTEILHKSVLARYQNEFRLEGIELSVSQEVLDRVVSESLRKETGARSIEATLMRYIEDAAFEAFSTPGTRALSIVLESGEIDFRLS